MLLKLEEGQIAATLQQVAKSLAPGEIVLDFRAVQRIDSVALRTLEELVRTASEKQSCIVLRGVNVDLYKAIKLLKPAGRFSFAIAECT